VHAAAFRPKCAAVANDRQLGAGSHCPSPVTIINGIAASEATRMMTRYSEPSMFITLPLVLSGLQIGNSLVGLGNFITRIGDLHAGQLHHRALLHPEVQRQHAAASRRGRLLHGLRELPGIPSRLDGQRVNRRPNPAIASTSRNAARKRCRPSPCAIAAPVSREGSRPRWAQVPRH
jgi:hypothetical protein